MPQTSNANGKEPRPARGGRARRLPYLPIVLLVVVAFLVLAFVTFRQLRSAREHRLRLLAGFGDRVELTVPQLAGRFARIIQDKRTRQEIEDYLEIVPYLQLVGEPRSVAPAAADDLCAELTEGLRERVGASSPCLVLQSHNDQIELVYVGVPGERPLGEETIVDEAGNVQTTEAAETAPAQDETTQKTEGALSGPHVFFGRISLHPLLREILIADVFDSILVASTRTGRVLHQEGEPALVVADIDSLLARSEPRLDLGGDGPVTSIVDVTLAPNPDRWFDEGSYKMFLQPVSLDADLPGGMNVAAEEWVAGGLIADERLLASGFSTSPLLLFLLVISFPSALVLWPFVKLWLISPRQSMTRLDIAALVASSLLGLTLVTLLVFDLMFLSRLHLIVDDQLQKMARGLELNLRGELETMRAQLADLGDRDAAFAGQEPSFDDFDQVVDFLDEQIERTTGPLWWPSYPYFHSIFWADEKGKQTHKLPLRDYALLTSQVRTRWYYQCAWRGEGYRVDGRELCVEPIFSNTTGRDLVAMAERVGEREVAVLTTVLLSLREPALAPGFGFALVDETGLALFHSDSRRNMTEDFLKASDEDRLLTALLAARRPGHVTVNYWGDRSRLYLLPIEGLPWTLIAYRSSADLRLRNFEVIYDFLTGALPYFLVLLLLLLVAAVRRQMQFLWPTSHNTAVYRSLVLLVAVLTGLFALSIAFASPPLLFWISLLLPVVGVIAAGSALLFRKRLSQAFEIVDAERGAAASSPLAVRLEISAFLVLVLSTGVAFWVNRGFISGFLFVAGLCATVIWPWLRSFFLASQRRLSFIAALAALLFASAVLPAVGLFQLATSRQLQYLIQDTQTGLAQAIARSERSLAVTRAAFDRRGADWAANFFGAYAPRLTTWRERLLSAFFDTEQRCCIDWDVQVPAGSLWPVAGGEDAPLHMTILSARPAPPSEIATSRLGLDLSRFDPASHEWQRRPTDRTAFGGRAHDAKRSVASSQIVGRFLEPWGTGREIYLASTPFSRSTRSIPPLRFFIVTLALLALVTLPAVVARFLADRVLLARLARVEDHVAPLDEILASWRERGVELQRVLLVTSVPDLAVREAEKAATYECRRLELPEPTSSQPARGEDGTKPKAGQRTAGAEGRPGRRKR